MKNQIFIKYKKKFINHLKLVLDFQFKINKYLGVIPNNLIIIKNINQKYFKIVNKLLTNNLVINDIILPSLVNIYLKDLTIKPFWTDKIKKISDKLFLPEYGNLCPIFGEKNIPKQLNKNNWFETEVLTGNYNYFKIKKKKTDQNVNPIIKCRKIKLFFSKQQREYFSQIIGTYRYFYNRTVAYFNNYDKKLKISWFYLDKPNIESKIIINIDDKNPFNFISMRSLLKKDLPDWILPNYPSHLIDQAINECFDRFNTCLNNYKKTKKKFSLKFKSKKQTVQTINLEKIMINKKTNSIFNNWKLGDRYIFRNLKTSENFNKYEIKGSSISLHKILKKYTLNLNYETESTINKSRKICSIDPGIRNFLTVYSQTKVLEIGRNTTEKIYKICKEIDIIQSRMNRKYIYKKNALTDEKKYVWMDSKKRKSLRKALHRKIEYLKNLKDDLHNKSVKYFCSNYHKIIYPPFESQKMVSNLKGKIARMMYNLSFYKFKQKLISKGKETNTQIIIKPEFFTSKTCGKCGKINFDLKKSDEIFNCSFCKLKIGRDINGARNILLRNFDCV
ncbi:Transposase [uncultured virus]|nr:Transposase [uncultured virus]